MKFKIEFEGDFYEDKEFLENTINSTAYVAALHDIQQEITQRLKHCEVSESEETFLEHLRDFTTLE